MKPIGQIVDQRVHRRIDDVQDHPSRPYNGARHYHLDLRAAMNDMPFDGIAKQKAAYLENGVSPSNAAYGYVLKTG